MIQKKPLVNDLYTADPSAHAFNGKIYIYPSHDEDEDVENNDNGDQYNMNEAVVPCPRLGYRDYVVSVKVDHPDNKLMKIGGVFIDGELAIKAPYDMEEYISTVINIAASNDDSGQA